MTPTKDETTWAMIAHLTNLINLVTGVFGPVVAIIIYFSFRDRSSYVRNQAMQSFVYQMITVIFCGLLAVIAWVVTGLLSIIVIGICLIPFAIILTMIPLVGMIYSILAAVDTASGRPFQYLVIGNWVKE
jgi:uncharacterized Tic20 family protein